MHHVRTQTSARGGEVGGRSLEGKGWANQLEPIGWSAYTDRWKPQLESREGRVIPKKH